MSHPEATGTIPAAMPVRHRNIAIGAGALAVLLGALDTYVVVSVFKDIIYSVGISVNKIQQVTPIVTSYLLGYIAAMPLLGQASDRFGRRLVLQSSLAGFAVGSVVTAMSDDLTTLVIGRTIQGVSSGALLPVTLALAADLWAQRDRAKVLGGVGAAQELGSVLGPLYGVFCVWLFGSWKGIFWVNVPLAAIAMVLIHFSVPPRREDDPGHKVDLVGGTLLAIALGLMVVGLYNPAPEESALPTWGVPVLAGAGAAALLFVFWELRTRSPLIDRSGLRPGPFLAALGASVAAGAALMVTLVNVELLGQGVLGLDDKGAVLLLLRFLIALPIGAVLGGWLATRYGDRVIATTGLVIAAIGYYQISHWPIKVLDARYDVIGLALPRLDVDLVIAGIGLGLVIGPLSSAALRAVPEVQHGIASALVVVARMTGMLIGMAALGGWGIHRFHQIVTELTAQLPKAEGKSLFELKEQLMGVTVQALNIEYSEIFRITSVICLAGAVIAIFVGSQRVSGDEAE